MTKKMDENFAIATQKRVATINLSAEERYTGLIKSYPEFLLRFPQKRPTGNLYVMNSKEQGR